MKYCPNLSCGHRVRCGTPAELLDRVVDCPDCGTALIDDPVVALAGAAPIGEAGVYRASGDKPVEEDARVAAGLELVRRRAKEDMNIGMVAMGFGGFVALLVIFFGLGGGLLAIVPFCYGAYRFQRGWKVRKAGDTTAGSPR